MSDSSNARNKGDMAPRFLVWSTNGWIAGKLHELLQKQCKQVFLTSTRMEDRETVMEQLASVKPTHVINAAGCTGRPNVDWCESNKEQTIRSNVIGTLNLADCCFQAGIHCTIFATGCIYNYDDAHPIGGPSFTEDDEPNFDGSFYSHSKGHVQELLKSYQNCLVLRVRMPTSDDLSPRSFVTKILSYKHIVNIPNSHSILHDLLPAALILAENHETGILNFVNPGAISHNEVLDLFKEIVRPSVTYQNFSIEEQAKILKAGRSNCELDTHKLVSTLEKYGLHIPEIHQAYRQCFKRMKAMGIE
ncbi:hypothetical protein CDD81_7853 [Ophiocordyceps australis]|uniref:NAD-dependent epimerase/dehydratase domain-containing protein n=1 Tax=Ophiocordyceps australis TaxID=1399860 RepID=A0A2C5YFK0_9HYPO|nr:hypothetical protein CDD81_7853 [Ophiocordyceps australis]